jgi:hypothetical protein
MAAARRGSLGGACRYCSRPRGAAFARNKVVCHRSDAANSLHLIRTERFSLRVTAQSRARPQSLEGGLKPSSPRDWSASVSPRVGELDGDRRVRPVRAAAKRRSEPAHHLRRRRQVPGRHVIRSLSAADADAGALGVPPLRSIVLAWRARRSIPGSKREAERLRWTSPHHGESNRDRREKPQNRAIACQSSSIVVMLEPTRHAGGRGFESRRSRLVYPLNHAKSAAATSMSDHRSSGRGTAFETFMVTDASWAQSEWSLDRRSGSAHDRALVPRRSVPH